MSLMPEAARCMQFDQGPQLVGPDVGHACFKAFTLSTSSNQRGLYLRLIVCCVFHANSSFSVLLREFSPLCSFLCITIALSAFIYIKAALRRGRLMFETGRSENMN